MSDEPAKPLLILDVDETLIFGSESELDRPADFFVGPYHIYRRPYLQEFLGGVARWYELAIWSSATTDYVNAIATSIRPIGVNWRFVWGRDRCTQRMNSENFQVDYIKDLKKVKRLGYDLDRIRFIDDTPAKLARNHGNAVYVKSFTGSVDDEELKILCRFLESIRDSSAYRSMEKRGWRSRFV